MSGWQTLSRPNVHQATKLADQCRARSFTERRVGHAPEAAEHDGGATMRRHLLLAAHSLPRLSSQDTKNVIIPHPEGFPFFFSPIVPLVDAGDAGSGAADMV